MTARPIQSILIVGGGTAGWMAAMLLNRTLRTQGVTVTLVESADIGTIGVGEATIPSLVQFLRDLRLDEGEFMRAVSASYKLGIRFVDWIEPGHQYWHPFGVNGGRIDGLDLFHFWQRLRLEGSETRAYTDYSLQATLAAANKGPRPVGGSSRIIEAGGYAYHLDAGAFATYLRELSTREGVIHIYGTVREVKLGEDGGIAAIDIGGERTLAADLYVDCTGFAGLLNGKTLGEPWIDWSDTLLCDRAVAMPTPNDGIPPYTQSTAEAAGWIWRIALSTRMGNGYVHSSAHVSEDEAISLLLKRSPLRRARSADPRVLKMRIGRRRDFWVRNSIAIGLSGSFVEPIESTGIHLIQRGVEFLLDHLPDTGYAVPQRLAYNRAMGALYDEVHDFILLHYYLSRREEPFWRDARAAAGTSDSLQALLALYDETGRLEPRVNPVFQDGSWYAILAGGGRLPRRPLPRASMAMTKDVRRLADQIIEQNALFARRMPDHTALVQTIGADPGPGAPKLAPSHGANGSGDALGRQVVGLVEGLGVPSGVERSFKLIAGAMLDQRLLLSVHKKDLGADYEARVISIVRSLEIPPEAEALLLEQLPNTDIVHFGVEEGEGAAVCKAYLEFASAWRSAQADSDILVHLAIKWDRIHPGTYAVARYSGRPSLRGEAVASRMLALFGGRARSAPVKTALGLFNRARGRVAGGDLMFMEVSESGNDRRSFDLNLYQAGLTLADIAPHAAELAQHFSLPLAATERLRGWLGKESLGHISGGIGRDGGEFLTVYHGVRPLRDLRR